MIKMSRQKDMQPQLYICTKCTNKRVVEVDMFIADCLLYCPKCDDWTMKRRQEPKTKEQIR